MTHAEASCNCPPVADIDGEVLDERVRAFARSLVKYRKRFTVGEVAAALRYFGNHPEDWAGGE